MLVDWVWMQRLLLLALALLRCMVWCEGVDRRELCHPGEAQQTCLVQRNDALRTVPGVDV